MVAAPGIVGASSGCTRPLSLDVGHTLLGCEMVGAGP